jgi:predicted glycogen debranching enzyme
MDDSGSSAAQGAWASAHAPSRTRHSELPITRFEWPQGPELEWGLEQEWIATNGLGGYASGTVVGCNTRRYHALLVANLPNRGRTVMLPYLREEVLAGKRCFRLGGEEQADGTLNLPGLRHLRAFRLTGLIPEWEFQLDAVSLRRKLVLVHGENTVVIAYQHLGGPAINVRLRPFPHCRPHDQDVVDAVDVPSVWLKGDRIEARTVDSAPPLRLRLHYTHCRTPFVGISEQSPLMLYRVEQARGYEHRERLMSPGYFECSLAEGETLALVATTEGWESASRDPLAAFEMERQREDRLLDRAPAHTRNDELARLVMAADQFLIEPVGRPEDMAWARATGQAARSIIAGYHWFSDWGRDTMISLEGLTLATGRQDEAADILRTFQHHVRDGLIPNHFPEGEREGLYHTADATLWYFHAIDRYVSSTQDDELLWDALEVLADIVEHHLRGTRFHIGVDPSDGLLRQGASEFPLTWMDAWVGDWVATPRRGKTVEINSLWFNALCLMADWSERFGLPGTSYREHAARARESFNRRFWNPAAGCLYDVVDGEHGDDPSVRPNQLFSFSLRHPVLQEDRWAPVLQVVEKELLTFRGLRTLAPRHPDYQPRYDGDRRGRDGAYHQGTIWPWLLGHYLDAAIRVKGAMPAMESVLRGATACLGEHCIGQISEIFDADPPFRARGCVAQAWSVAETLRGLMRLRSASGHLDGTPASRDSST